MADTTNAIIDNVIRAEGGATVTNNPADKGGRTQYGISETSNPQAWADGKVTEDEARAIYMQKYLVGTNIVKVADPRLQAQLLDYAVVSGPGVAIMRLQEIVGVKADGVVGTGTLGTLGTHDAKSVNNALVKARALMICRLVQKNPTQLQFLAGWIARALEFYI